MTHAIDPDASHRRGMLGWFGGAAPRRRTAPTPVPVLSAAAGRTSVQRKLYEEIGDFLFANDLDPSPRNFTVIHAYLSGDDGALAVAITRLLRDGQPLTDEAITAIVEGQRASELSPDALSRLAGALEERLVECIDAVDRSRTSAATFGSALDVEAGNFAGDPDGTLRRVISLTRDAVDATRLVETQLKRTQRETDHLRLDLGRARRAADHDHLTALPNRRAFEARAKAVAERVDDGRRACVAICDIDDFKQINDRFGHEAGDRVLKFVATFLKKELSRNVLVSRYGGEEFACIFEEHDAPTALAALDQARERLAGRKLVNQETGESIGLVTFSAGLASLGGRTSTQALRQADLALYTAKRCGKNAVQLAQ